MERQPRTPCGWDLLSVGLVASMLAAHLRFAMLDQRLPPDLNHCYNSLPLLYELFSQGETFALGLWTAAITAGGPYQALLALAMRLGGVGVWAFHLAHGLALLTILTCVALIARRKWGAAEAACALLLISPSARSIVELGRAGWIHTPEIALVLVATTAAVFDTALRRWRSAVIIALAGMCALSLRLSALVWLSTLAALLILHARQQGELRARGRRLLLAMAPWALGLIPSLSWAGFYFSYKLEGAARYSHMTGFNVLAQQLIAGVGLAAGACALLGTAALISHRDRLHDPHTALFGSWILVVVPLVLFLHAGLDNFPAFVVALALLGAAGLGQLPRRVLALPALAWLAVYGSQWMPQERLTPIAERLPIIVRGKLIEGPLNFFRPFTALSSDDVRALARASCADSDDPPCRIIVDHGLFLPDVMEPGYLPLFLVGDLQVELIPLWLGKELAEGMELDAYARWYCGNFDRQWIQRHPELPRMIDQVMGSQRFTVAWSRDVGGGCEYVWMTPARGQRSTGAAEAGPAARGGQPRSP